MTTVHIVIRLAPYAYNAKLWSADYQVLSVHAAKSQAEAERMRLIGSGKSPDQIKVISKRVKGDA